MSEKRFELYSDDYFFGAYDTVTQERIGVLGSIKLLNSLSEENEQLKSEKIGLLKENINYKNAYLMMKDYEKENEQLRKELKELNRKYIAFSEATDKRLKEMVR